jgi:hypothetical protein
MKPLLSLLAALALAVPTHAQSDGGDGRKVRIQFRALSFDEPILGAAIIEGKKTTRMDISPNMFTTEQTYVGPSTLSFYKITLKETKEEEPQEVTQSNAHLASLAAKAKPLADALAKLQAEANSLTLSKGERGGGKISKYDQDKLDELYREMDVIAKQLAVIDAEIAKTQQAITSHIQNAQAEKAAADKKKKEEAAKGKAKPEPAPAAPKKPEPVEAPVQIASCTFTDSGKYLLLFFKDGDKHRILVLDDKENVFPYGSIQYVNLTRKPIQVRYGAKVTEMPANGRAVINAPAPNESYARGEILTPGEDGYQLGFAARTFQQQDVRTLFFVTPVETEGSHIVQVKGIEERRPPPEAAPDAANPAAKGGKAPAGAGKAAK